MVRALALLAWCICSGICVYLTYCCDGISGGQNTQEADALVAEIRAECYDGDNHVAQYQSEVRYAWHTRRVARELESVGLPRDIVLMILDFDERYCAGFDRIWGARERTDEDETLVVLSRNREIRERCFKQHRKPLEIV